MAENDNQEFQGWRAKRKAAALLRVLKKETTGVEAVIRQWYPVHLRIWLSAEYREK